jgi:predicted RNA-binding protein
MQHDGRTELILEEVMLLEPRGTGYRLVGLLGEERILEQVRLLEIDFERDRILLCSTEAASRG